MRWVLLVLALVVGAAQSQDKTIPPVAGQAKASDKKNSPSEPKQEITVNLPPSINLNLGGKLDIKSENVEKRAYEEPSKWTDPMVLFTFVIAVANIMLWRKTGSLVTEATKASRIAKEAADTAHESAKMGAIAAQTSRDEFIATHRPRIRVKHLWMQSDILGEEEIKVSLVVVNHGDTSARNIQGEIATAIIGGNQHLPAKPLFAGKVVFKTTTEELLSGITLEFANLTDQRKLTTDDWLSLRKKSSFLYCYGYIDYLDAADRVRKTTFCRKLGTTDENALSADNARFVHLDPEDTDYEYQD